MKVLGVVITLFLSGCISIPGYDHVYLDDEDMQPGADDIESFEHNAQSYREGSSGGGGKTGGGCGCQ